MQLNLFSLAQVCWNETIFSRHQISHLRRTLQLGYPMSVKLQDNEDEIVLTPLGYGKTYRSTDGSDCTGPNAEVCVKLPWSDITLPRATLITSITIQLLHFTETTMEKTSLSSVSLSITLDDLKRKIGKVLSMPAKSLRVAYKGKELSVGQTLITSGVVEPYEILCVCDESPQQECLEILQNFRTGFTEAAFSARFQKNKRSRLRWEELYNSMIKSTECISVKRLSMLLAKLESGISLAPENDYWRDYLVQCIRSAHTLAELTVYMLHLIRSLDLIQRNTFWNYTEFSSKVIRFASRCRSGQRALVGSALVALEKGSRLMDASLRIGWYATAMVPLSRLKDLQAVGILASSGYSLFMGFLNPIFFKEEANQQEWTLMAENLRTAHSLADLARMILDMTGMLTEQAFIEMGFWNREKTSFKESLERVKAREASQDAVYNEESSSNSSAFDSLMSPIPPRGTLPHPFRNTNTLQ